MKEIVETLDDLAEVYQTVLRSTLYQGQEEILESIRDSYGLIQEELVGGKFQHESKEYEVVNLNENFEYDVVNENGKQQTFAEQWLHEIIRGLK